MYGNCSIIGTKATIKAKLRKAESWKKEIMQGEKVARWRGTRNVNRGKWEWCEGKSVGRGWTTWEEVTESYIGTKQIRGRYTVIHCTVYTHMWFLRPWIIKLNGSIRLVAVWKETKLTPLHLSNMIHEFIHFPEITGCTQFAAACFNCRSRLQLNL